jgi:hypothetical protein
MLGAPALLLFASGVTLFINGYVDTVARAVAIDASRYAALADQDYTSAKTYLDQKLSTDLGQVKFDSSIEIGQTALVTLRYSPISNLVTFGKSSVQIRAASPVEK